MVPFIFCHQKTNQKSAGRVESSGVSEGHNVAFHMAGGIVDFVLSGGFQSAGALPHLLPLIKPFPSRILGTPGPPVKNRKAKVRL
jgi:hypothetical protein